ncbi:galactose-specific lectin nattectin-like [Kryptolebias marmoratus]|uniref:galactose-specific lectin nattectin-like n=1 Tax=Kryptolebias marmoratus TaxID=37003 RepID=UPI0018AD0DF4|nr:galactose-specific lectin nattectin-like [Kryptolebias marmoratus]
MSSKLDILQEVTSSRQRSRDNKDTFSSLTLISMQFSFPSTLFGSPLPQAVKVNGEPSVHTQLSHSNQDFCNSFGAHLTSIRGDDEYDFIRGLVLRATGTNTRTWVGGTDAAKEGYWVWTDGSPFTFTAWGSGEPNNVDGNENCMEINLNGQDYVNDVNCSLKNAFICAKDA